MTKHKLCFLSFLTVLFFGNYQPLEGQEAFKEQLKNYDRDDIHSIHKRLFSKEKRHEFSLNTGALTNNGGFALLNVQYQYHFFESFGVQAVNAGGGVQFGDSDKVWFYTADLTFSPIYGKISFFTWAVVNFDLYVLGGLGFIKYDIGGLSGNSFLGTVGFGERFFINEFLSVKVELRDYIWSRDLPTGSKMQHDLGLTAGVSMLFPFEQGY